MQLSDKDFENINPGEPRPLLEEGCWPAQCVGYEPRLTRWGEKLFFRWQVYTSLDKTDWVMLERYYNLTRDKGNRMVFGHLHDYRKDCVAAVDGHELPERTRLSPSILMDRLFLVEVVTVRRDSNGSLAPSLYYSKIGRVIRPLAKDESWERLPIEPLNSIQGNHSFTG